jgi:[ribosomal protein S5]-alanine N-acetyltransferase
MTAKTPPISEFPEQIASERLDLRRLAPTDVDALFEAYKDPEHLRFLGSAAHRSPADTLRYIEDSIARWDAGDRKEYALVWRETGEICGSIGAFASNGRASIGIVVGPNWGGRRIAYEATRALGAAAYAVPGIFRVWAFCNASNEVSRAVLLRCGFVEEGVVRAWARFANLGPEAEDCRFFFLPKPEDLGC